MCCIYGPFYGATVGAIFLLILKWLRDLQVEFVDFISCCGNCSDILVQSTSLFIRPVSSSLFVWHFYFMSLPALISLSYLFFLHILSICLSIFCSSLFYFISFSLCLILCSNLQTPNLEQLARLSPSLSIHSPHHFAHAHCPASRPHFPPPLSAPSPPLPLFYLWEYADGANPGKDRTFRDTQGWEAEIEIENEVRKRKSESAHTINQGAVVYPKKQSHSSKGAEEK